MNEIIALAILTLIDIVGYIVKCKIDKGFASYKLRRVPFIWAFYN